MDPLTYQVFLRLNHWVENPALWPGCAQSRVPEDYIARKVSFSFEKDRALLIIGPRQAGKSTLVWHLLGRESSPWAYLNCEEPSVRELCRSPSLFLDELEGVAPGAGGVFFDEIQHLEEAALFLKGMLDLKPGVCVVATGSSSFHLRARTRESLAGRARRCLLLPFSLAEVSPRSGAPTVRSMERRRMWETLLVRGGYPEAFLSAEPREVLGPLVEAFVLRDASDLHRIRNPQAFRRLLGLVASQTGDLVNFSHWAEVLGISVSTVGQYLGILEESHVIRLLPPYVGGKRAELTSRPKAYFLDNGLRNYLFGGLTPLGERQDAGRVVENFVFTELSKAIDPFQDALYYWRSVSSAEVDFVLLREGWLRVFEVKATALKRPRIPRALRSFIQAYGPAEAFVVNTGLQEEVKVEGTPVRFVLGADLPDLL